MRLDCCKLDWSKWWSQSRSVGGGGSPYDVWWVIYQVQVPGSGGNVLVPPPGGKQVHSLILHCTSWAVFWSKAPEITLGMLLGFLVASDPLLRHGCCLCLIVKPVVPLRRDEYPQACVWMWMIWHLGDFYTWANCVKKEISMIKSAIPPNRIPLSGFLPCLTQNPPYW